ncbi:MAG: hypothetical protein P1P84_09235 [Deferrisomatales bacterium]|nr:hypothetical protein [Deferrisomatales bacterium]
MNGRVLRVVAALSLLLWAAGAGAGYRVTRVGVLQLQGLDGTGQVADPRTSPGGGALGFEFLGAGGDTLEVYTAALGAAGVLLAAETPQPALPVAAADPFELGHMARRPVSEQLSWGPPKRGRPRFAVAATRKATARGAGQVNFDLHLTEPGRLRFLTEHPGTDAQPAFHPGGEYLAFSSGRSGQGDIYLHHFFAAAEPLVRLSYEAAGSELYPTWDPSGERLAFVSHLGGEDHVQVVDEVAQVVAATPGGRRQAVARRVTRDLTPGWRVSCLAPSFSPDGRWIAFYAREGQGDRADLYVVATAGGEPRRLLLGGLPETRGGPRWAPTGGGLFAVREDAEHLNPLFWVPLAEGAEPVALDTGTELNADPWPVEGERGGTLLLFTAQGSGKTNEKRWRRIYQARLEETQ